MKKLLLCLFCVGFGISCLASDYQSKNYTGLLRRPKKRWSNRLQKSDGDWFKARGSVLSIKKQLEESLQREQEKDQKIKTLKARILSEVSFKNDYFKEKESFKALYEKKKKLLDVIVAQHDLEMRNKDKAFLKRGKALSKKEKKIKDLLVCNTGLITKVTELTDKLDFFQDVCDIHMKELAKREDKITSLFKKLASDCSNAHESWTGYSGSKDKGWFSFEQNPFIQSPSFTPESPVGLSLFSKPLHELVIGQPVE